MGSKEGEPPMKPVPQPLYFVDWRLDGTMIGGLSILTFVALTLVAGGSEVPQSIVKLAAVLAIFVNYPHFSATVYRLYQDKANLQQFPVTSIAVPILLLAAVAASFWRPSLIAPYFFLLFLLWSPYHYSGQTLGITLIYARRSNFTIGRWQRLALSTFIFGTLLHSLVRKQTIQPFSMYGVNLPPIVYPRQLDQLAVAAICFGGIAFLWFVVAWCRTNQRLLPPIVLLPAAAQTVWFLPGIQSPVFYLFVPLFHCLQYLYIAWAMQVGLRVGGKLEGRSWRAIRAETLRWGVRNYLGGIVLFVALPLVFYWVDLPAVTVAGVLVAAVNIHHFFVDGVIWKIRNPLVASPLMMNIADLAAPARATVP
jgi:hypothetical protein